MMGAWRAPGCNRIGRRALATVEVFGDWPALCAQPAETQRPGRCLAATV